ncbi:sugar-binding protein [Thalassotalea mangrovi]|uniref:Sugar-binding protein n=1 Tax=Thalassotalea mangrovi TaxID=2572245 RepID=A0A4U1B3C3_9GAMM|nr:sugar-binding protein [Thalassotalea mangrovi]TKB44414.1 sugar-binding protein [Thalassotalea mangrovi]
MVNRLLAVGLLASAATLASAGQQANQQQQTDTETPLRSSMQKPPEMTLTVPRANSPVIIDGVNDEKAWQQGNWQLLNHVWVGEKPTREDFSGRYKLVWQTDGLYLLVELIDDVLFDQHANPLHRYWDDDCLEIFIDEDGSGGEHAHNFNAFAYHIGLDNQVADMGPRESQDENNFILLNHHVESMWKRSVEEPFKITWEVKVLIFDDDYDYLAPEKVMPKALTEGKKMGFLLAYCDNDGSKQREHFIGSHPIEPVNGDMNLGYKDASVFAEITLLKGDTE